jgi:hypothetical protein
MNYRSLFRDRLDEHNARKSSSVKNQTVGLRKLHGIKEEEKKDEPITKQISRLMYIYSSKVISNSNLDAAIKYNSALNLLNQAQLIADTEPKMALKLYTQARKLLRTKGNG